MKTEPRQSQRYTSEELKRIDKARKTLGGMSRASFIKAAVAEKLTQMEAK